ncbi:hypothetical protein [Pedobacter boryungensis]|uniref:DUF3267 domain-containing protein n=1 Tax=Pedobacter boryungensis TaxID=869962 RepID=A0ABX2DB29_9SPHI|nr:hypothetical protein [Pedobacter boryungensis]NQX31225.1 hypothetical protein [Pedobacter boryungensis]
MTPSTSNLKIQLTFKNLLLFIVFFFLMHELHELAHIITGRVICGCWGTRDFNVWQTCAGCNSKYMIAATFAGPLFTFIMLWIGRYFLKYGTTVRYQSFGLLLILGNMQFGRMYMAAMGSGDEVWGVRSLFLNADHSNFQTIKMITFLIVTVICVPPLITAYKAIANKKKILLFIGFLIFPLILDTIMILIVLNGILNKGFLNQEWIMGTPFLTTLWFLGCALIVGVNYRFLGNFAIGAKK